MKHWFTNISLVIGWCSKAGAVCASLFLFIMTMLLIVDIIGRKLGYPTGVAQELSGYFLVVIVMLSLAYTLRVGSHIKIDLVTSKLSQEKQRRISIMNSFISMAFSIWLVYYSTKITIDFYTQHSTSMTALHVPLWAIQLLVPLGLLLFTMEMLLEIVRSLTQQPKKDVIHPDMSV